MNRNLINRLLLPVLLSGITVLSSNNFANAQSSNSCERYISNMNGMESDFYERMSAYQRCVSQWINGLPKQPSQSNSSNGGAISCSLVDSQIRKLESIRDSAQSMANRTTSPSMATAFMNQAIQAQNQIISLSQKCR